MFKKRFLKLQISWVLSVCVISNLIFPIAYSPKVFALETADLKLKGHSAILMEATTGEILYETNADEAFPPASMSKMMTEYLVLEHISTGKINWDNIVTTSQNAADVIGSGQLLAKDETLTVRGMFEAMSIYSANDASVALAEFIAGSEEDFAQLMNLKAKELGLSDKAYFINATGLSYADMGNFKPTNLTGETMMTSRDAAILARALITHHSEILTFSQIPSKKLRESDASPMINWNWMLENNKNIQNFKKYAYIGLDGLKTGHTIEAGYCFTGTAQRNGMRLISVVMGTSKESERFEETRKLLDYGFNHFEIKTIVKPNVTIESLSQVNVRKGIETEVPLVTEKELQILVKKGAKEEEFKLTTASVESEKIVAPIAKGASLGTLTVEYEEKKHTIQLVAATEVKKAGITRLFFRSIGHFFIKILNSVQNIF
jgi:D-alanyl-D-alanine carboxypeptidase (penicillin-binding protein 5/6)